MVRDCLLAFPLTLCLSSWLPNLCPSIHLESSMSTTSITAAWRDLVQVELLEESRPTLSQVSWFNDVLRLTGSTIP